MRVCVKNQPTEETEEEEASVIFGFDPREKCLGEDQDGINSQCAAQKINDIVYNKWTNMSGANTGNLVNCYDRPHLNRWAHVTHKLIAAQITLAEVTYLPGSEFKDLRVLVTSVMPKIRVTGDRCDDQRKIHIWKITLCINGAVHCVLISLIIYSSNPLDGGVLSML